MKFLLDTCFLSEIIKPLPDKNVIRWLKQQHESDCCISVLTIGELEKGINKLPASQKREQLQYWLKNDISNRFAERIIPIDTQTVEIWGRLQAKAENVGKKLPVIDGLLASTAIAKNLTFITRNIKDVAITEVITFNPWGEN